MKRYDITIKGFLIMSSPNKELIEYLRECRNELRGTIRRRWGLIMGWQLVNLDSLVEEGLINEDERKAGSWAIHRIYHHLDC